MRFPALALARTAMRMGGGAPAALNAANEIAVAAFLGRQIGFIDIASSVAETLERMDVAGELAPKENDALDAARAVDRQARCRAAEVLSQFEPVS